MRLASRAAAASHPSEGNDWKTASSAPSVAGRVFSSSQVKHAAASGLKRSASTLAGRVYVEAVLNRYLWLPGTPTRISRHDRRLARTLYEGGVPLAVVQAALLLGASRRTFRAESAPPLPPIRTLHFFLPLVDELREQPLGADYLEYLEQKLLPWADAKAERVVATMG